MNPIERRSLLCATATGVVAGLAATEKFTGLTDGNRPAARSRALMDLC